MSYRTLPLFERGVRVQGHEAKQDKIHLEIGEWTYTGDDSDIEIAIRNLRSLQYTSEHPSAGRVHPRFSSVQGRTSLRKLPFSSPTNAPSGSLLIGGVLKIARISSDDFSASRYKLTFDLQLNPTRALNHQPLHVDVRAGRAPTDEIDVQLYRRQAHYRVNDEIALERNDNVILDRRKQSMSVPRYWHLYRDGYLRRVAAYLHELLTDAFPVESMTGRLRGAPRFNLKSVENYWEFRSEDPVRLVYDMAPSFRSMGTRNQYRLYSGVVTDITTDGHCPSVNFKMVEGVKGRLYAKTNKRVRFEIIHDMRLSSRVRTSHTASNISDIVALIEQIAQHDAAELNTAMETLERIRTNSPSRPAYELVRLILQSAPDRDLAPTLLSIIVNHRGIRCPSHDPFRASVMSLVTLGVLERSRPSSSSFRVSEQFQQACAVLSSEGREQSDIGSD